jgi:hypothetical protein
MAEIHLLASAGCPVLFGHDLCLFFLSGVDSKCPAGSLSHQAAHLPVPGTVMWDPGKRNLLLSLGTRIRDHLKQESLAIY